MQATTRKAWWQVSRDKEALAAGTIRRRRKPALAAPSIPANPSPSANNGMLPSGIEPPEEEPPKYTFEFMSAKDWTKETDKGDQ